MSEQKSRKSRPTGRAFSRLIRRGVLTLLVLILIAGAVAAYFSTPRQAPDWLRARIEARLNQSLTAGSVGVGGIELVLFEKRLNPKISITDVVLRDAAGQVRAELPEMTGELAGSALAFGRVRPVEVEAKQARIRLARGSDGRFDIQIGGLSPDGAGGPAALPETDSGSLNDILADIEALLGAPLLAELAVIRSTGTRVSVEDAVTGRSWEFTDGLLELRNTATEIVASVTVNLDRGGDEPASASFGLSKEKGVETAVFTSKFRNLSLADLAEQFAEFAWLNLLDAPVSGSVMLDYLPDGSFGQVYGVLDVGAGALRPDALAPPVRFNGAKAYFSYDYKARKISFDELSVDSDTVLLRAEGHAYLNGKSDAQIDSLITQLRFTRMRIDPGGVFAAPLEFDLGAADMRVRFDPLSIDLGQLVLLDGDSRFLLSGRASSGKGGWRSALDLKVNALSRERLLGLWPLAFKPKTRTWMETNILKGEIGNVNGALRSAPGQAPKINVGFDVSDLSLRYLKTLPPIEAGAGYGVWADNRLNVVLERGVVTAPDGGRINAAGTSFSVADTRLKKAPAVVGLKTQSSVTSLMSLIDLKPFEFISKAGLETDMATGTVSVEGEVGFPLSRRVTLDQVTLALRGRMRNVGSERLVQGKLLKARELNAFVDGGGLTISGEARLGNLPVSGLWRQEFGPEFKGRSKFEGQIELSQRFLDEFRISLPKGTVNGVGRGQVTINLVRGKAPEFRLVSDLNRLDLSLAALGWSKPKTEKASLEVLGSFGRPPDIRSFRLTSRGLSALGSISLKPNGSLELARFEKVDIGGWLKAPIDIRSDGQGHAVFAVTGGTLDFRKSKFARVNPETNAKGNQISVALDRLILSNGIALTAVSGVLNTTGGLSGSFSGRVNGGSEIKGALAPYRGGTAVRFTSSDAGAVMRSAGLFRSASGGRLDMLLVPTGKRGQYEGTLQANGTRVRNAPALAGLLSAISVIGLLEQLGGEGILFNQVDAKFLLTPGSVGLQEASAVGSSLGLTMQGVYDFSTTGLTMQGVITPIYVLNGILEQTKIFGGLFGRQKGEGLFGFNYTLNGPVDAPKVGVNPLSILTPGMFRDIFRRPIPQTGQ